MGDPQEKLVILAVDDDALILMGLQEMIEEAGYMALTTDSAAQALDLLHKESAISLVIADLEMFPTGGLDLASEVRICRPHLPIIISTGHDKLPDGSDPLLRLLRKPYTFEQLDEAVRSALKIECR
jgi:DNA-binding NtrC family response regulator